MTAALCAAAAGAHHGSRVAVHRRSAVPAGAVPFDPQQKET